jgi:phosphoglycolate phosphatase-like HAD superfamily hydrolase
LERWFASKNIAITGSYGLHYYKPSTLILEKIKALSIDCPNERVVYFGDREVDKLFADNARFNFIKV